jgi:hypothetical protein
MLPGIFARAEDGGAEPEDGLVVVIGFSGDRMKGVLGVTAKRHAVVATHPLAQEGDALTDEQVYDWLAELSNQLLGRIKGELMSYGVTLWLASPVVLRGVSVRIVPRPCAGVHKYTFHGHAGDLCVWIDYQYAAELELVEIPEDEREHCTAGDMLLF